MNRSENLDLDRLPALIRLRAQLARVDRSARRQRISRPIIEPDDKIGRLGVGDHRITKAATGTLVVAPKDRIRAAHRKQQKRIKRNRLSANEGRRPELFDDPSGAFTAAACARRVKGEPETPDANNSGAEYANLFSGVDWGGHDHGLSPGFG
jgi:hypothetical protein